MTEYGQSIPPRWYRDVTPRQCTKVNMAWHVHRALLQVGMLPIRSWNPFDLELPQYEEFNPGSARSDLVWYYDLPTNETFEIGGIPYRPVLCMVLHIASTGSGVLSTNSESLLRFEYGHRRADRLIRDDFSNLVRLHTSSSNYGVGAYNSAIGVSADLSYASSSGWGAWYQNTTWKTYAGSADANRQTLVAVGNIHVMLTGGGLVVQVGSGMSKTDSNDILSFSLVFGGARIPGRARIPSSDPNLNRINPVFVLPHRVDSLDASAINYWVDTLSYEDFTYLGVRPASWALGVQHDLKIARGTQAGYTTRPGAVRLEIFNLENIERPLFPSPKAATQNSPRTYNGSAAHILQPMVYSQSRLKTDSTDFYQVQNFDIRSQMAPAWEDIWYCPKYRFADRTAPYGEYVDPVTNTNWFLFRASGINSMLAIDVEGVAKFSSFDISTIFNLQDTDYYNLNGGFTWTAGNPEAATASQTAGSGITQAWTPTASVDEATCIMTTTGSSTWSFNITDPVYLETDTSYTIQLEIRWYSVSAQGNTTSNPMYLEYSSDNGSTWVIVQTIFNTGNAALPYNAYTMTPELPIWPSHDDARIRFRIRCAYDLSTGGNRTAAIRSLRVRRYARA